MFAHSTLHCMNETETHSSSRQTASATISLRIRPDELALIDQLAAESEMNRTEYLFAAGLGRLNVPGLEDRLDDVEERLAYLEGDLQSRR